MIKKSWICLCIIGIAPFMAFTQDTSVNVNFYTIPELSSVPVIDGDLSDTAWTNVPEIPMDKDGDSPAAEPGTGDLDIKLKVAWDDETNALYFGINVIDEDFVNTRVLGSSLGTDGYNNERLEIILDSTNTGDSAATTTSGLHQQYVLDMPNNWDPNDPDAGLFGYFDQEGGIPVSTTFVSVPVFERIEGSINVDNTMYPFNIDDENMESAVQIRVTNAAATEWADAPVEFNWEAKIVPYAFLIPAADLGYDLTDPANIADGWKSYWADSGHEVLDMEPNAVIGFTAQQNDSDIYTDAPAREHQTNTTGVAGNWNSSESLTGLILGPKGVSVSDWSIR